MNYFDLLPDEMIVPICRNMDIQTLTKTMRANQRLNRICGEVLNKKRESLRDKPIPTGRFNIVGQQIYLDDIGQFTINPDGSKNYGINPPFEEEFLEEEEFYPEVIMDFTETGMIDSQGRPIFRDIKGLFVISSMGKKIYIK